MAIITFRPGHQRSNDVLYFRKQKDGRLGVSFGPELKVQPGDQILPQYDPVECEWIFTVGDEGFKAQPMSGSSRVRFSISRVPPQVINSATNSRWTAIRKRNQIIAEMEAASNGSDQ